MDTTEHWLDRLSDYLDGDMDERDRAACAAHLAMCPSCADAAAGIRAVVAQASLAPPVAPSRDLWPGIDARLAAADSSRHGPMRRFWRSEWTVSVPMLAAAAIAMVVLTAGTVWVLAPGAGSAGGSEGVAADGGGAFLVAYAPAIAQLEREYEAHRSLLEPETRRVVEENLAIIDRAIAESERALAEDPSNAFVTTHLAGAMRQKVDLLRRVTSIPVRES